MAGEKGAVTRPTGLHILQAPSVGAAVGNCVGAVVGDALGAVVGDALGVLLGAVVGVSVGLLVGPAVGAAVRVHPQSLVATFASSGVTSPLVDTPAVVRPAPHLNVDALPPEPALVSIRASWQLPPCPALVSKHHTQYRCNDSAPGLAKVL
jgi:hypothetical protein